MKLKSIIVGLVLVVVISGIVYAQAGPWHSRQTFGPCHGAHYGRVHHRMMGHWGW